MKRSLYLRAALVVLALNALAGCGGSSSSGASSSTASTSTVAVTTTMPLRQSFKNTVEGLGTAIGDPHHAKAISVAHAGQVTSIDVSAGETVKRGQPLLTITADPSVRNAYSQAQTALQVAMGDVKRVRQLAAVRLATQSQLAAAIKAQADARTALQAQRAMGGASRTKTIKAPSAGVVTALSVSLGNRIAANTLLLSFTPKHALLAQLGVQPESGEKLAPGMPVTIRSVYGPDEPFIGKVTMVGQSIDPQTHLLSVQAEIPILATASLPAGTALTGQINAAKITAWAVPRAAVLNDQQGDYLFQVENGHAKRIDVKLVSPNGDPVGVQGPLDPHAPVIALGAYELSDGDAVKVNPSNGQTTSLQSAKPPSSPTSIKPSGARTASSGASSSSPSASSSAASQGGAK